MKLNKEIYPHCVQGWNNGATSVIQIEEKVVEQTQYSEFRHYRIDLYDLLPLLRGLDFEVIEPKGARKYIYLRPKGTYKNARA